jgi:transcription antitermination protein NusB
MANRHLARSVVLQTLFEWDFNEYNDNIAQDVLLRNIDEFASGATELPFMQLLLRGVIEKRKEIDSIIEKAAPDWPLDKIATIDRNILRMGLFELLFVDKSEVPAKVAINEAIELGKSFGGDTSGKFINGVLGAVYKELGEPGKEDESPKKKKDIPFEEMPVEEKVGAVVYSENDGQIYFGLVHDVFGHWTLSKGGLKEGEDDETGLRRVIKEEMNLDLKKINSLLGETEYVANHPEKGKHRKQVRYYLVESDYCDVKLQEGKSGLDAAQWFKIKDVADLNFYNDIVPLITQSITTLIQEKSNS